MSTELTEEDCFATDLSVWKRLPSTLEGRFFGFAEHSGRPGSLAVSCVCREWLCAGLQELTTAPRDNPDLHAFSTNLLDFARILKKLTS